MHCAPCLTPFWKGECRRDVKSEKKKKKKAHVGIKSKTEKKDELLGEKVQRNKKGNTVGALRIHLCAHEKRIMGGKEKKNIKLVFFFVWKSVWACSQQKL